MSSAADRTVKELARAAGRERWAPRIWWGGMAVLSAVGVWAWARGAGWGWPAVAAGAGVLVAWAAPWAAVASFRIRRPEENPPEPGGGTEEEWRAFAGSLAGLLSWASLLAKGDGPEAGLAEASKDLRGRLKRKAPREELEAACMKAVREAWLPSQRWFWNKVEPEIREIRFRLAQDTAPLGDDECLRFKMLGEAMADAASLVLGRLNPTMLAGELLEGVRECVGIAFAGAGADEPLVELAAAVAMEWGNWILPWKVPAVRWKASEFLAGRVRDGIWDLPEEGMWGRGAENRTQPMAVDGSRGQSGGGGTENASGQAAAGDGRPPEGGEAAAGQPARRRVRVKVWRKERRHGHGRRRRQSRRAGEVLWAFWQRIRYLWAAWRLYRR